MIDRIDRKREVLVHVAKYCFEGTLEAHKEFIPLEIVPHGSQPTHRCCVYREREVLRNRVDWACGRASVYDGENHYTFTDQPVAVMNSACEGCPLQRYTVTSNCQHCMAQRCLQACRFGAITMTHQGAIINPDKCRECGMCAQACPYNAIVKVERRQGKGNVVRQMMRDIDAEAYLMVDGDDTYPAEAAPALLAPLFADEADMVVGDRLSNGTYGEENDRAFHGFGNDLVRFLIKAIYGFEFSDVMTGYRAYNKVFAKTMPVLSPGFEIETELSIHAVDKRWRIAEVPIDYRDRPEGSESKLSTFSDGFKVLMMIMSLFKDYKPLALFSWVALLFVVLGLVAGVPVIAQFAATGLVPKLPTALLAAGLVFVGLLCFACGLILDTVVKGNRKQYEIEVTEAYERYGRSNTAK